MSKLAQSIEDTRYGLDRRCQFMLETGHPCGSYGPGENIYHSTKGRIGVVMCPKHYEEFLSLFHPVNLHDRTWTTIGSDQGGRNFYMTDDQSPDGCPVWKWKPNDDTEYSQEEIDINNNYAEIVGRPDEIIDHTRINNSKHCCGCESWARGGKCKC